MSADFSDHRPPLQRWPAAKTLIRFGFGSIKSSHYFHTTVKVENLETKLKTKFFFCLALILSANVIRAEETNVIGSFGRISAKEPNPSDDALRSYLAQSDLVAVGEIIQSRAFDGDGQNGHFKVDETIKGEFQRIIPFNYAITYPGPNIEFPDGKMVLFLWQSAANGNTWQPRDLKFGALPANPTLVDSLKRIAATQNTNSGELQLEALIRRFALNCTLRELKYNIGNQEYSTAVLNGPGLYSALDRREMKWIPGTPVVLAAAVVHRFCFGQDSASNFVLIILTVLTAAALLFDFLAGMFGANKFGATWRGALGAVLGGLIGLFFSLPGILLGPFIGATLLELLGDRELKMALKAGLGATLGLFAGIVGKFAIAVVMILLFATNVIFRSTA